jgi:hypothetical protein
MRSASGLHRVRVLRFAIAQFATAAGSRLCTCSPGAPKCKTLQNVSSRRDDAGRNRRHSNGIGAIKLEAAPRYQILRVYSEERFTPETRWRRRDPIIAPSRLVPFYPVAKS